MCRSSGAGPEAPVPVVAPEDADVPPPAPPPPVSPTHSPSLQTCALGQSTPSQGQLPQRPVVWSQHVVPVQDTLAQRSFTQTGGLAASSQ